ncbi:uncharacterized protein [Venturia canescens]|uniref:uncharacterized protein n=1 Tax=Venturia canescens TaxID=32260 RepID=UPI001C9BD2BE|nr:uncharacterized protein LOC122410506 [Venturia canescens]XP_043274739.1 uncharacterized protein LOC122410575 [Venturia canescens]
MEDEVAKGKGKESSHFWDLLEKESGVNVPAYIKNILKFNNFDNPLSFRHITPETIKELEEFSRHTMKDLLEPETDLYQFYGRFHKDPQKFQFMIGDRHLIEELVIYVKSKTSDFWKLPATEKLIAQNTKKNPGIRSNRVTSDERGLKNSAQLKISHRPDINIEEERKKLTKIIISLLRKENVENAVKNENSDPMSMKFPEQNLDITISVVELYNGEDLPQSYTYSAKIKCVICANSVVITKCGHSGDIKARWVVSNYRRHLHTHSLDTAKTAQKRKSMSILQALQPSAKTSKTKGKIDSQTTEFNKEIVETVPENNSSNRLDIEPRIEPIELNIQRTEIDSGVNSNDEISELSPSDETTEMEEYIDQRHRNATIFEAGLSEFPASPSTSAALTELERELEVGEY